LDKKTQLDLASIGDLTPKVEEGFVPVHGELLIRPILSEGTSAFSF
jgi:hypothetical protein